MDFPPFLFAGIRQFTAGLILASYLLLAGKANFPPLLHLGKHMLAGFLMITLGNGLVSWAEVYIPSGIAAIICSFMPVWVTLINITLNRSELPNGLIVVGVLIGMGGILMVFSENLADFVNTKYQVGIAFVFIASLAWAIGSMLIKRSSEKSNPFFNAGLQMIFGGIGCFILSLFFEDLGSVHWSQPAFFSLVYLILVGSVSAFVMYVYALTRLPMTIASLYSYVNPLVAVLLGWIVIDEKFNVTIAIAMVITVLGIYLVNKGYQRKNTLAVPKQ
jgi:drug/metabolite transporter (DMT)-like permease